jgi:lipopolysaccharide/colanic/teichoic acid biosynthesis glycosyltransferase
MNFRLSGLIGLGKKVDFLVLLAAWYILGSLFAKPHIAPGLFPAWVLITTIISMITLSAIGYFDHHIPKPELSSVVSLLFALPLSAFLAKWIMMLSSNVPPIRYSAAFRASIWVALAFELSQILIFKMHRAMGRKWTLVTHLDPSDQEALRAEIESAGAGWWIQLKPYNPGATNGGRMRGDETIVISRKSVHHLSDHADLLAAHLRGQRVVDVHQLLKEFSGRVKLDNSDGWTFLLASTYQNFALRTYFYVKQVLEILLAAVLLVCLSPLLLGVSLAILLTSGMPIFYRQERLGYRGQKIMLYKFRTMRVTAESSGPQWAKEEDPRVTPLGRWLRKTRLDELPQLLNVIRGELSFVGPRPERPEFYQMLKKQIPLFATRLLVRPGITGWAQVRQGYAASVEECKAKLEYDLYYVQHMSPRMDVDVMINTAAMMFRGNGGR